jgi:hypothetical protein
MSIGVTLCQTVGGCHDGTAAGILMKFWGLLMYCNPHLKFWGLQPLNPPPPGVTPMLMRTSIVIGKRFFRLTFDGIQLSNLAVSCHFPLWPTQAGTLKMF